MTTIVDEPVLARFKAALEEMYGDRLDRIVLFGSRARGDAREDSDYDLAVFLRSMPDRWAELDRLAVLGLKLLDDLGVFIDAKPYLREMIDDPMPLMHEVRKDGREL